MSKGIKDFNKIAALDGLELVKDKGYFYFWGTTDEMQLKCAHAYTTMVIVYAFNQLTFKQWLQELEDFKKTIAE